LSLPAACALETAGEAVAQTVCEMLREREEPPC
ncbi:MAG: dipicolinic acid synthetase, partial [Ruminococcaceae bacterium]|nr:dipicolinic acid synthetase [Oscillospiraceae bacterium]